MVKRKTTEKTIVGEIDRDVLAFTVGSDSEIDLVLAEADCLGSAAHVTMLADLSGKYPPFTTFTRDKVIKELVNIIRAARAGKLKIRTADQDIHMLVERLLTQKLGELGKKIHLARSRNDQVATDLRLYAKEQLHFALAEIAQLATTLLCFAQKNEQVPMVGRTHMQPAMPSSVGLWAAAHVESLLDDSEVVMNAYDINNRCPLGAAASYGVPLAINRNQTSRLLGFDRPVHNVLYANNARGKCESLILSAMGQIMLSLSRLAQDLIIYTMPEFGYFSLPPDCCTGSSIMPQKKNPDVLELIRAKSSTVLAHATCVASITSNLPSGYSRDLQETKRPFIEGITITRSCLDMLRLAISKLKVDKKRLTQGFTPQVFAVDHAYRLVNEGIPFREAYARVKGSLPELESLDPATALANRKHLGGSGKLGLTLFERRIGRLMDDTNGKRKKYHNVLSRLLGTQYPQLRGQDRR